MSDKLTATIYSQEGKETGNLTLSSDIFALPWNADLVHQVVTSLQSSARKPIAHTKNRGEVSGGGKKPWQQKGTGRARHGSIRSPIWVGGGVTHGPRKDKNYARKVNKRMKDKALFTVLSRKFKDGEILFIKDVSPKEPKAREAKVVLDKLGSIKGFETIANRRKNNAFITTDKKNPEISRGFSNFSNVKTDEFRNINVLDVLKYKYLVISAPESAMDFLSTKKHDKKR